MRAIWLALLLLSAIAATCVGLWIQEEPIVEPIGITDLGLIPE